MKRQFFREHTNSLIYNAYLIFLAQMSCTTHTLHMLLHCIFSSFPTEIVHSFGKHIGNVILPLFHSLGGLFFYSVRFAGVLSAQWLA